MANIDRSLYAGQDQSCKQILPESDGLTLSQCTNYFHCMFTDINPDQQSNVYFEKGKGIYLLGSITITSPKNRVLHIKTSKGDLYFSDSEIFTWSDDSTLYEINIGMPISDCYIGDNDKFLTDQYIVKHCALTTPIANNNLNEIDTFKENLQDIYNCTIDKACMNELATGKTIPRYTFGSNKENIRGISYDFNVINQEESTLNGFVFPEKLVYGHNLTAKSAVKGAFSPEIYPIVVVDKMNDTDYDFRTNQTYEYQLLLNQNELQGGSFGDMTKYPLEPNDEVVIYLRKPGTGIPKSTKPNGQGLDVDNYIVQEETSGILKCKDPELAFIPIPTTTKEWTISGLNVYDQFSSNIAINDLFSSIIETVPSFNQDFHGYSNVVKFDKKHASGPSSQRTSVSIGKPKEIFTSQEADIHTDMTINCSIINGSILKTTLRTDIYSTLLRQDASAEAKLTGIDFLSHDNRATLIPHLINSLGSFPTICFKYGDGQGNSSINEKHYISNGIYYYDQDYSLSIFPYTYNCKLTGTAKTIEDRAETCAYAIVIGRNGKLAGGPKKPGKIQIECTKNDHNTYEGKTHIVQRGNYPIKSGMIHHSYIYTDMDRTYQNISIYDPSSRVVYVDGQSTPGVQVEIADKVGKVVTYELNENTIRSY